MGSGVSCFTVSLIVTDREAKSQESVHKTTTEKENGESKQTRTNIRVSACTALPARLNRIIWLGQLISLYQFPLSSASRRSSFKGRERAIVYQTSIGTVSTLGPLGKLLRRGGVYMGLSEGIDA